MKLIDKQKKFSKDFALLLVFAFERDYQITFPPEHEHHIKNSCHYIGLAKDINLFDQDGVYLTKTEDYEQLGDYWESLGNTWGGRFKDGNHFSIEHNGVR